MMKVFCVLLGCFCFVIVLIKCYFIALLVVIWLIKHLILNWIKKKKTLSPSFCHWNFLKHDSTTGSEKQTRKFKYTYILMNTEEHFCQFVPLWRSLSYWDCIFRCRFYLSKYQMYMYMCILNHICIGKLFLNSALAPRLFVCRFI